MLPRIGEPSCVTLEKSRGLLHHFPLAGDHSKTAAALNVLVGEIKGSQVQVAVIEDHQLAVITHEVARGARHHNAGRKRT